jgi:hypothetical protein
MSGVRPSRLDTMHKWIEVSVSWSVGLSPDVWSQTFEARHLAQVDRGECELECWVESR